MNKKKMNKLTWLIGISGSEMYDVTTYKVTGSIAAVKDYLVSLVKAAREADPEAFGYGTTSVDEVSEVSNGTNKKFYAEATFSCYHNDYTATQESGPYTLIEPEAISDTQNKGRKR